MTSIFMQNFKLGLVVSRLPAATDPGSLIIADDVYLTSSLELHQRKEFVKKADLSGTVGLAPAGPKLYVFSSDSDRPANLPDYLSWQQLSHPTDSDQTVTEILSHVSFKGRIYVIAKFSDQSIHHFYDGSYVQDWKNILAIGDIDSLTDLLEFFRDSLSADADVSASIDGTDLVVTGRDVDNDFDILTKLEIAGQDQGQKITQTEDQAADTDKEKIIRLSFTGPYQKDDIYSLKVNHVTYRKNGDKGRLARFCAIAGTKLYAAADHYVFFSAVDNATDWKDRDNGDGFLKLFNHPGGEQEITGMASYRGGMVFFTRDACQIWFLDPDPALDRLSMSLNHMGCISHKSIQDFADKEVLFLANSGIQSLRRNIETDTPYAEFGVGTNINKLINQHSLASREKAKSIIDAGSGQYWLWIDDVIYVLSSHGNPAQIQAWSRFLPGMNCDQLVKYQDRVYVRSGDDLFLYGGDNNEIYGGVPKIGLPHLRDRNPINFKQLESLDIVSQGDWQVEKSPDPRNPNIKTNLGVMQDVSFLQGTHKLQGYNTYTSLTFTAVNPKPDRPHILSQVSITYSKGGRS